LEKTILVVGGAGGVGQTVSKAFCEEGNRVVVADVNLERLRSVAKEIGRDTLHFQVDVKNEDSVSKLVQDVVRETGRIDSLFAVHGVTHGKLPVYERSLQEWEFVLGINLTGTFLCIKHVAPVMIRQKKGCIVALTTSRARPDDAPYYTSKMGIEGLVGTAALDLKDQGVGVFVVAPGGYLSTSFHDHSYELMKYDNFITDNEMREQQRAIKPEVVVPLFLHLNENVPLDLVGKKITAIDWNEQHGLGRETWYYQKTAST
jgi:NAD(P)-dependent dehydrogenase (short-subunit alcohol dehydrogenase family)